MRAVFVIEIQEMKGYDIAVVAKKNDAYYVKGIMVGSIKG